MTHAPVSHVARPASHAATPAPRVRPGDMVGVCLPAGPANGDALAAGLRVLKEHYQVVLGAATRATIDGTPRRGPFDYLADDDLARAEEFNGLLRNPDVRAIIVGRGGYGIMRILPLLDRAALLADPKPIVGLSDATALLAWAHAAGVRAVHGPMVVQYAALPADDLHALIDVLAGAAPRYEAPANRTRVSDGAGARTHPQPDKAVGPVVGGNLTLVAHLIGTPWAVRDGILLLEDVGERPYSIDRLLTHLHLAGALTSRGAVIGDFTRCRDPRDTTPEADHSAADAVLTERLRSFAVPALFGLPFGHETRNLSFPIGANAELDPIAGVLNYVEPATR